MSIRRPFKFAVVLLTVILFIPAMASAQFVSAPASTNLSYTVSEILTVSTDTPSLNLTTTQQTINVTVAWNVQSNRTALDVIGYVTSATPLGGAFGTVNASDIFAQGQNAEASCTQTMTQLSYNGPSVGANGCANIFSLGAAVTTPGNHTAPFKIRINPAATYAPGTYTGTVFFIAAVS